MWEAMARPVIGPNPGTTLTTPGGKPAAAISSANFSAVNGVCSAGLRTTVLPAARHGPSFHAVIYMKNIIINYQKIFLSFLIIISMRIIRII